MDPKPILKSKTMWLNLLALLPVLGDALAPMLLDPAFQGLIPAAWLPYYTVAVAVANIYLRTRTNSAVTLK
jgi:hypothetical protein